MLFQSSQCSKKKRYKNSISLANKALCVAMSLILALSFTPTAGFAEALVGATKDAAEEAGGLGASASDVATQASASEDSEQQLASDVAAQLSASDAEAQSSTSWDEPTWPEFIPFFSHDAQPSTACGYDTFEGTDGGVIQDPYIPTTSWVYHAADMLCYVYPAQGYVFDHMRVAMTNANGGTTHYATIERSDTSIDESGVAMFTFTPSSLANMVGWKLDNVGNIQLTPYFANAQCDISVSAEGSGWVSGAGTYDYGDTVTLKSSPDHGWQFDSWRDSSGETVSTEENCTFTCDGNAETYTAVFTKIPYVLSVGKMASEEFEDDIEVSYSPVQSSYGLGDKVQLSTTIDTAGAAFVMWYDSDTGVFVSNQPDYTLQIAGDTHIFAVYLAAGTAVQTVASNPAGLIPNRIDMLTAGESVLMQAPDIPGYHFRFWNTVGSDSGGRIETASSLQVTAEGIQQWTAYYEPRDYVVLCGPKTAGEGSVSILDGQTLANQASLALSGPVQQTFTALPAEGYRFVRWNLGDGEYSYDQTLTFYPYEHAQAIAEFKVDAGWLACVPSQVRYGYVTAVRNATSDGGQLLPGDTAVFTAHPFSNATFDGFFEGDTLVGSSTTFTAAADATDHLYIARFHETLPTITASLVSADGQDVTSAGAITGAGQYAYGTSVTLAATLTDNDYEVVCWTDAQGNVVDGSRGAASITVVADESTAYFAHVAKSNGLLSVAASPIGGGTAGVRSYPIDDAIAATQSISVALGDQVLLSASPSQGKRFAGWMQDGRLLSTCVPVVYPVYGYQPVTGYFVDDSASSIVAVEARANDPLGGTVSGSCIVSAGSSVTVKAAAANEYRFTGWFDSAGRAVSREATYTFAADAGVSLTAHFSRTERDVSVSASPTEGGDVAGGGTYRVGDTATLVATPSEGYLFDHWEDAAGNTVESPAVEGQPNTCMFTVSQDVSYTAVFTVRTYPLPTITYSDQAHESWGSVSYAIYRGDVDEPLLGVAHLEYGDRVVFRAVPTPLANGGDESAYAFAGYKDASGNVLSSDEIYVVDEVSASADVTVDFTERAVENVSWTAKVTDENANRALSQTADLSVSSGGAVSGYQGDTAHMDYGAQENDNLVFDGWYRQGEDMPVSTELAFDYLLSDSVPLEARFHVKTYYVHVLDPCRTDSSIAASVTNSTRTVDCYREAGDTVPLAASANDNTQFLCWTVGTTAPSDTPIGDDIVSGQLQGTVAGTDLAASCVIDPTTQAYDTMNTLYAQTTFCGISRYITAAVNDSSMGGIWGEGFYYQGETCALLAVPMGGDESSHYEVDHWEDADGNTVESLDQTVAPTELTFITEDSATYTVLFKKVDGAASLEWMNDVMAIASAVLVSAGIVAAAPELASAFEAFAAAATGTDAAAAMSAIASNLAKYPHDPDHHGGKGDKDDKDGKTKIISKAEPETGGSATGGGSLKKVGSVVTLKADPKEGYTFTKWTHGVSDASVGNDKVLNVKVTETMGAEETYTAHFEPAEYTVTVQSKPANAGDYTADNAPLGADNKTTVKAGDSVLLKASPNQLPTDESGKESDKKYAFEGWYDDAGLLLSSAEEYRYTPKKSGTIEARYDDSGTYKVTATASPTEGGIVTQEPADGKVEQGESITLKAKANEGYYFDGWYDNDTSVDALSKEETYKYTPTKNISLVAKFTKGGCKVSAIVSPASLADNVEIIGAGNYAPGSDVELTAGLDDIKKDDYVFEGWFNAPEGGEPISTLTKLKLQNIDSDKTVYARYHSSKVTVKVRAERVFPWIIPIYNGSTDPSGTQVYRYGEEVTLSATPKEGYTFSHWYTGKEGDDLLTNSVLVIHPKEDGKYIACFDNKPIVYVVANATEAADVYVGEGLEKKTADPKGYYYIEGDAPTYHLSTSRKTDDPSTAQREDIISKDYYFMGWYSNGRLVSLSKECDFDPEGFSLQTNASKSTIVEAAWRPISHAVVALPSPDEGGTVATHFMLVGTNDTATVSATPNPGYTFKGWYNSDLIPVSTDLQYTFTIKMPTVLVAKFDPIMLDVSASTVVSNEGERTQTGKGGSVSGTGQVQYGNEATLTATPEIGYEFSRWEDASGTTISASKAYTFTPTDDTKVTAVFVPKTYQLKATANQDEYGEVSGSGTYDAQSDVTLTAMPAAGCKFIGWYENGICVGTDESYKVKVDADRTFSAQFTSLPFVVTTTMNDPDAGTVSGEGGYRAGDEATLRATPRTGYYFEKWVDRDKEKDDTITDQQYLTFTVEKDVNAEARFGKMNYLIEVSDGSSSTNSSSTIGQEVKAHAQTLDGKKLIGWYASVPAEVGAAASTSYCVGTSEDLAFTLDEKVIDFMGEGQTLLLEARYADASQYVVAATTDPQYGGCSVEGDGTFNEGETATLTAVPGAHYAFDHWENAAGHTVSTSQTYSFTVVEDEDLVACFTAEQASVTIKSSSMFSGEAFLVSPSVGGSAQVDAGTTIVAVAVPVSTGRFMGWLDSGGNVVSYSLVLVRKVSDDRVFTAVFDKVGFQVTATVSPAGSGIGTTVPFIGYTYDSTSIIFCVPYPGWTFVGWYDEKGRLANLSPVWKYNAIEDKTFTARMKRIHNVVYVEAQEDDDGNALGSVDTSDGDETAFGNGYRAAVALDGDITLFASAHSGYHFTGWYASIPSQDHSKGDLVSAQSDWTFTPDENYYLEARFEPTVPDTAEYTSYVEGPGKAQLVTQNTDNQGEITEETTDLEERQVVRIADGASQVFRYVPEEGAYLSSLAVSYDAVDLSAYTGGSFDYTAENMTGTRLLKAVFATPQAPQITGQPVQTNVVAGQDTTLVCTARSLDGAELQYQWYKDGKKLSDATQATLAIGDASSADEGVYQCEVGETLFDINSPTTFSDKVRVTIVAADALILNASSLSVATCAEAYAAALVPATGGTAPYTYTLKSGSLPEGMSFTGATLNGAFSGVGLAESLDAPFISGTPTTPGSYEFTIAVNDAEGAQASAVYKLLVDKLQPSLSFSNTELTYNGQPQAPALSGVPDACAEDVVCTYVGTGDTAYSSAEPPTHVGTYQVTASIDDAFCTTSVSTALAIVPQEVSFSFANGSLDSLVYDGEHYAAAVSSAPELSSDQYQITYVGTGTTNYPASATPPAGAGAYRVTVGATDPDYTGSASSDYQIAKADQTIEGRSLYAKSYGDADFLLDATAITQTSFTLLSGEDVANVSAEGLVSIKGSGVAVIEAQAPASINYNEADPMRISITVSRSNDESIQISDSTVELYDGQQHGVAAVVTDSDGNPLAYTQTYTGIDPAGYGPSTEAPTAAGIYVVQVRTTEPNYRPMTARALLTITDESVSITVNVTGKGKAQTVSGTTVADIASGQSISLVIGGSQSLRFVPDAGSYLSELLVGGVAVDLSAYAGGSFDYEAADVQADTVVDAAFAQPQEPQIVSQSGSMQVHQGDALTLACTAESSDGGEIAYQWYRDGVEVDGATQSALSISAASAANAGVYSCKASETLLGASSTIVSSADMTVSVVEVGKLVYNASALAPATCAKAYTASLGAASDGSGSCTYALAGGSVLPEGLVFSDGSTGTGVESAGPQIAGTPAKAGKYTFSVVATDAQGATATAAFTLVVDKVIAPLSFDGTEFYYDGTAQAPVLSGVPQGFEDKTTCAYTGTGTTVYGPSATAPAHAGTYRATAMIDTDQCVGAARSTFSINPSQATITIGDTYAVFDGGAHAASVTSAPALDASAIEVEYLGVSGTWYPTSNVPPVDAGTYLVTANVKAGGDYEGSAQTQLVIAKANQSVEGSSLYQKVFGDAGFLLTATAQTAVEFSVESGADVVEVSSEGAVRIKAAGGAVVQASAPASGNYNAATPLRISITVAQSAAVSIQMPQNTVVFHDGKTHGVAATVTGNGGSAISYTQTYTGVGTTAYGPSSEPPANAGTYKVQVITDDPNYYQREAVGLLVIANSKVAVTVSAGGDGAVSVLDSAGAATQVLSGAVLDFVGGTSHTFKFTPAQGQRISRLSVNGIDVDLSAYTGGTFDYVLEYVATDCELSVEFAPEDSGDGGNNGNADSGGAAEGNFGDAGDVGNAAASEGDASASSESLQARVLPNTGDSWRWW